MFGGSGFAQSDYGGIIVPTGNSYTSNLSDSAAISDLGITRAFTAIKTETLPIVETFVKINKLITFLEVLFINERYKAYLNGIYAKWHKSAKTITSWAKESKDSGEWTKIIHTLGNWGKIPKRRS